MHHTHSHVLVATTRPNVLAIGCDLADGTLGRIVREGVLDGDLAARDGAHAVLVKQADKAPVSN